MMEMLVFGFIPPKIKIQIHRRLLPFQRSDHILVQSLPSLSHRFYHVESDRSISLTKCLPSPRSIPFSGSRTSSLSRFHPIHGFPITSMEARVEEEEANYGDFPLSKLLAMGELNLDYSDLGALSPEMQGQIVLVRGRLQVTRSMGKKLVFLVLRDTAFSIQCIVAANGGAVSEEMVQFVSSLSPECLVVVNGLLTVPTAPAPIRDASQQNLEIQVRKIFCISRRHLPISCFLNVDAARSDDQIDWSGQQVLAVNGKQASRGLIEISSHVSNALWQFLSSQGFVHIFTPKSHFNYGGGSAMVELDYESHPPCLLDAPELYMQMYICGDLGRVFEIRSPLKPRDSLEYTFVDVEMEIQRDYFEVMDIVGRLFVTLFDSLTASCKKELEAIGREYPFVPLKYLRKTLLLTYQEGIQMLKDAGIDIYPLEDLNMEEEMNLGQLVREKYGTEFYILHRHPLVDKPFNTMPCYDDPAYSNSFYAYIRGKRIISGAQRIDNFEMLIARAQICGIDMGANREYFDVFRAAAPPHGGFRAALEDVVMSFLGIDEDSYVKATSIAP